MSSLPLAVAAAAFATLVASYLFAFAWRIGHVYRLRQRVRGHLVLTFDDGPGPRLTTRLQALLQQEGVHATFFVTGFRADRHPEILQHTVLDGHELASHSQLHLNAWRKPWQSVADTQKGLLSARSHSPYARFFRPPFGKATLWTHLVCWLNGFQVVYWTIDCKDAELLTIREPGDVCQEMLSKGGGVVLLHDLDMDAHAFPEREDRVLGLCHSLIHSARSHGMNIVALGHLFPSNPSSR